MSGESEESRGPRMTAVLAIALLVFAVVAGGLVLLRSRHSGTAATPPTASLTRPAPVGAATPSGAPTSPGAPTGSAPPSAAASLPPQTVPVTGPAARWVTVKTLDVPVSLMHGPQMTTPTVMAGYEHSPTGALFALADNDVRITLVDDWKAATLAAVADTPGRAAFLKVRAPYGVITPSPGELSQIAGFNVVDYTPGRAVVQLLRVATDGTYTTNTETVVWERGDWKVLLPPSGELPPPATAASAAGYVRWQAPR